MKAEAKKGGFIGQELCFSPVVSFLWTSKLEIFAAANSIKRRFPGFGGHWATDKDYQHSPELHKESCNNLIPFQQIL